MNPEIKAKWVAALRSGEYVQGRYCLKEVSESGEAKYCCLGVLCEVALKEGVAMKINSKPATNGAIHISYDHSYALLPNSVIEWSGLGAADNPIIGDNAISNYNDGYVKDISSFSQIADLIEKEL